MPLREDALEDWIIELLDELSQPDAHYPDIAVGLRRRAEDFAPWPAEPVTEEELAGMPEPAWILDSLAAAFAYHYREPEHREDRRVPYAAGQWQGRTEHLWPPAVGSVGEDIRAVWEEAATRTGQPLAAARLHDLLFLARHGDRFGHIVRAVEAYVAQADASCEELDRGRALGRALEIAVAATHDELRQKVVDRLLSATDASLAGDEHKPGVTLGSIRPLVTARLATEHVGDLLARTRRRYADDPWITEAVVELQRSISDTEASQAFGREAVEMWLRRADETEGLSRHVFLDRAAELADQWGATDLRDEAARRMEAMSIEELELQVVQESVELSDKQRDRIEQWIDWIVDVPDGIAALGRLVSGLPPSGDVAHNRQQVEQHRQDFVFTALLTPKRLGYGAMPQFEPTSDEERLDVDLAGIEELTLQMQGPIYARALFRVGERFSPPTDDLAEALAALPRMTPGAAASMARALTYYWREEHEAAAMIALPRVETAARALLTELGEALFIPQAGSRAGQYPTLGSLLSKLRARGLDESWHRYLRTLLVAPGIGLNVRNDRLHGLDDSDVPPTVAALVILAALHLAFLTTPPAPTSQE